MTTTNEHIPNLTVTQSRLQNGLRVVSIPLHHLARAHVGICLQGGPVHETNATWGLSHVVEHMVFRGTKSHASPRLVGLAADAFGGDLDGATYRDRVIYDTRVDPDRVGDAVALLGEIVAGPRFVDVETEKQVIHEELLEALDDDGEEIDADNIAFRELFAGRPLARSIDGTLESLASFKRRDMIRFHKNAYCAGHMALVVAGPMSHRKVVEAARVVLGKIPTGNGPPTPESLPSSPKKSVLTDVVTDASQTTVRLLFRTPGATSPSRHALSMLTRLLDDGPASILPSRLIDGEGLAYELWAMLDLYTHEGAIEIGAQVAHERVGTLLESIVRELRLLKSKLVDDASLARVHRRIARDVGDFRDHPGHVVETVARATVLGLPLDVSGDMTAMSRIDAGAVRDAAIRFLRPENASLVLVGRAKKSEKRRAERAVQDGLS